MLEEKQRVHNAQCYIHTLVVLTDLLGRRGTVVEKLQEFEHTIEPILALFTDPEVTSLLESGK